MAKQPVVIGFFAHGFDIVCAQQSKITVQMLTESFIPHVYEANILVFVITLSGEVLSVCIHTLASKNFICLNILYL